MTRIPSFRATRPPIGEPHNDMQVGVARALKLKYPIVVNTAATPHVYQPCVEPTVELLGSDLVHLLRRHSQRDKGRLTIDGFKIYLL